MQTATVILRIFNPMRSGCAAWVPGADGIRLKRITDHQKFPADPADRPHDQFFGTFGLIVCSFYFPGVSLMKGLFRNCISR